jgi:hypothetical protein
MSALREEEPLTTAEIAGRQGATGQENDAALDQPNIGPDDRRPPRSAAVSHTAARNSEARNAVSNVDDISGGEIREVEIQDGSIASSPADPTPPSAASGSENQRAASPARSEFPGGLPVSPAPRSSSGDTASPIGQKSGDREGSPRSAPLFVEGELRYFRARWDQVQTSFVDEPRHAVEQADTLVATVVQRITEQFAEERAKLEQQWDRGDDVSTEELRQGLKRYRAFFDRLLSF